MAASEDESLPGVVRDEQHAEAVRDEQHAVQQSQGALIRSNGRQAHVEHPTEDRPTMQTRNEHQQSPAQAQHPSVATRRRSTRARRIRQRAAVRAFNDILLQRLHEGMDRFESLDIVLLTGLSRTYEEFCANFGVDLRALVLEVAEAFDIEDLDDMDDF